MSFPRDAAPLPELPLVGKDGRMLCARAPLEADAAEALQQVRQISTTQPE